MTTPEDIHCKNMRESLVKLWDAHSALKAECSAHNSWSESRWREYDREMQKVDKALRALVGEVGTLKIVTAIARVRLSVIVVISNAIGGAITMAIFWISKQGV